MEPPLTKRPSASDAKPTNSPSQRIVVRSSCVAAGADRHEVTFWSAAEVSRSAPTPIGAAGERT